ncbi:AAA family ATPase [Streptomyces sp. NPDC058470]|uniref:helix-turn-helix transcriptional regulator n=1 Tax=Streptomyces sp. NPDC058470 TaxID=3346515 RepID=UPI003664FBBE
MKLSERDGQLRLLDRLYESSARGKGAVVVMNGPVGCGKTALIQAFAERVTEQGGSFVSVTASAGERLHHFGLIDQLMNAVHAAGTAVAPFAAEDFGVAVAVGDPHGTPRVPLPLLQWISRTVCESVGKPLVISVDDVHFADEPSLECLRYLIRRIDSSAVMVVMNESSCHERELATLHAETLHLPYCHRIRVAPLTVPGVAEHLVGQLGPAAASEDAASWAEVSGGNPLLLQALIEDHLVEDGTTRAATTGGPTPGESFRHAFLRCLHRCEPSMLDAARALAVLGESASSSLISDFLGEDARSVPRSLTDLNAAGLLSVDRFRHEQAQLAVLADLAARDVSGMHRRAAELLHERGASATAVADQLMATHGSDRAAWRVDTLREAARAATASGGIAQSVDYLRQASGMCVDATQEAQVIAELAEAQWLIDPSRAARHLRQLSSAVRTGRLTGEGAMVPVKQLIWRGEFAQADSLLTAMEAGAGADPGSAPGGTAASDIATARLWLSICCPEPARHEGETGGSLGHPSTTPGPMFALTLLNLSTRLSEVGEEVQGADQVLHGTHADSPLTATLLALTFLIQTYRLDEAVRWSERLLQEPWIRHVPMRRALLETARSAAALGKGDVAEAAEAARTALSLVTPAAWGVVVGLPLALMIRASIELGDLDAVTTYVKLPVPAVMFDTPFVLPYLQAVGRHHLAMGRPQAALTNFQSCGDLMVKWRIDSSELADWRNDAAAALVAMGRTGQARTLIEEQLSRLGDGRSRAKGIALRRLAATSSLRDRLPLLHEAVYILAASGDQLELKRARADLEDALDDVLDAHDRVGPPLGRANPLLTRKVPSPGRQGDAASSPGACPGDEDAERLVAEEGEGTPVLAELTDAERRVGSLAVAGCTNREIAGKLFITVSTVEQHLTKIYRKLKVRNRSDLPTELMVFADTLCSPNGR